MSMSRYDPYGLSLRNAMDQLLTQSFVNPNWFGSSQQSSIAPMNVYETNNGYEVQVSLPGVKPHDIDLTVQQNTLDIKGKFSYSGPMTQEVQQGQTQSQQGQQSVGQQSTQAQSQQSTQAQSQQSTTTQSQQPRQTQGQQGQQIQQGQGSQQSQGRYNTLMQEMSSGSFERTITFPRPIDANKIHTNFDNGILTIWVPVSEESRPKKINVQSGQGSSQSQPQHVPVQSSQS